MQRKFYYDIMQGSDKWHDLRNGRLTSSSLGEFIFKEGRDQLNLGGKLIPHLNKVAAQIYVNGIDESGYQNDSMGRGKTFEPVATEKYEEFTFSKVNEVGFVEYGKYLGDSPDGLVDEDGCVEIKCRMAYLHFAMVKAIKEKKPFPIPAKDKAQCFWHMFVCGRKWCDYISYHPDFGNNELAIQRLMMDQATLEILETKKENIEKYIDQTLEIVGYQKSAA